MIKYVKIIDVYIAILSILSLIFITGNNPDYGIVTTFIKLIILLSILKPLFLKLKQAERGD